MAKKYQIVGSFPSGENTDEVSFITDETTASPDEDRIYVDRAKRKILAFDKTSNTYVTIAEYFEEASDADILNLFA